MVVIIGRAYLVTLQHHGSRYLVQRSYSQSLLASLKSVFSRSPPPVPPAPPCVKDVQIHHGRKRNDPFSWIENMDDPRLSAYIHAENEFTSQAMHRHKFLRRIVLKEMKRRLRTDKVLPPLKTVAHGYEYYSTTSTHGMVYLRKPLGQGKQAPEQVLLDAGFLRALNMSIRKVLLSPDHTVFAYNTEREGMEYGELHFRHLTDDGSQGRGAEILNNVFNFVWANTSTVYYSVPNAQLRPYRVYAHTLGKSQKEDVLIYEELDDTIFVDITSTKDMKYITINCNSLSSSEVRFLDAAHRFTDAQPTAPALHLVEARQHGIEYYVDHHDSSFYILTNANGATNFKLVRAPDHAVQKHHWTDVIKLEPTEKMEDVDLFQHHIVVYGRRDGLPIILCHDLQTQETHQVDLPEPFCVVCPGTNLEFNTSMFRFSVNSPFSHESTYEYDMVARQLRPVRVQTIRHFDRSRYTCTQTHVSSHDGAQVPVSLIHPKHVKLDGNNPVLMRSYGAYGVSTDTDFRIEHFPLLERGWVIALAHVRGGSELGRDWYTAGKLQQKMNSFHDFIAVAEHLVETKLTSPGRLTALGTSAGGLLVGAMMHMRPDLFRALVLRVPFVDPLSAMLKPDLPLTQVEYPEWGNPSEDADAYKLIERYSPYENISQGQSAMPAVLVTAGLKDQRVAYWQPVKLVARLRHALTPQRSKAVLLRVDLDRGHFGGGAEQDVRLSETAEQVAFLITQVSSIR